MSDEDLRRRVDRLEADEWDRKQRANVRRRIDCIVAAFIGLFALFVVAAAVSHPRYR